MNNCAPGPSSWWGICEWWCFRWWWIPVTIWSIIQHGLCAGATQSVCNAIGYYGSSDPFHKEFMSSQSKSHKMHIIFTWKTVMRSVRLFETTRLIDVSKIFYLPNFQNYVIFQSAYIEFRKCCLNPLAQVVIILALSHQAVGYVEPWTNISKK